MSSCWRGTWPQRAARRRPGLRHLALSAPGSDGTWPVSPMPPVPPVPPMAPVLPGDAWAGRIAAGRIPFINPSELEESLSISTSARSAALAAIVAAGLAAPALGGEAAVTAATAARVGGGWSFDVTVRHDDEGWEHYADMWRVRGPDGTVFGVRELFHPHVGEQPFTRSLTAVAIPDGVARVTIEAHDLVHGWGPPFVLELPR